MTNENPPPQNLAPSPAADEVRPLGPAAAAAPPPGAAAASASPAEAVGGALKAARTARGYSLESVCQHTRIPRKFIEAMEAGRVEDLPAPVYLRSFLTGYCEYLEVDFEPLWERLRPPAPAPAPTPAPAALPQPPAGREPAAAPPAAAHAPAASAEPARAPLPLEESPYFSSFVSALGAVLLSLALAVALVVWVMRTRQSAPAPDESQRPQALTPARPAVEPKLAITLREETWLSVRADGKLLFEGRAPKDALQQWQAQKVIELRTPRPESLDLTLNGAPYRLPPPEADGAYRIESQ